MIRSFKDLATSEDPLAGGKGATLARLYRAGYPVPDGFIILPAAFAGDDLTAGAWAARAGTARPPAPYRFRSAACRRPAGRPGAARILAHDVLPFGKQAKEEWP